MKIPVDRISPNPQQPRTHFNQEYIQELAQSIKENGMQNPILVEDNGNGNYTLVTGECRLRAHKLLGRKQIEATVRPATNHDGKQRLIDAMVENVQREDMSPVDEGHGYKAMKEMGMSIREISMTVGKNETRIRSRMMITDQLPEIQELISEGRLPHQPEALNALNSIPDLEERIAMARKLAEKGATVRMIAKKCALFVEVRKQARQARMKQPALEVAGMTEKPDEWDALYQVGRVPPWQLFTESVMATCDGCSMHPFASEAVCGPCPVVYMCQRLMEKTR